ncbi:hypothetical protein [Litorivicinus lipolyticus]|uniref:hypothetical protein n=1 Tax=Litorivicinus lipolyticus TaxID=418701 RepID=UPI003B59A50C
MKAHEFVRALSLIACLAAAAPAAAINGAFLPAAPRGPGGQDVTETGSGTRCSQSLNSPGAYVDVGMVGTQRNDLCSHQHAAE